MRECVQANARIRGCNACTLAPCELAVLSLFTYNNGAHPDLGAELSLIKDAPFLDIQDTVLELASVERVGAFGRRKGGRERRREK